MGLQTIGEEHLFHTKLKSDATTFVLTTSRQIAMPLQPKVKAELRQMEKMGVIREVQSDVQAL